MNFLTIKFRLFGFPIRIEPGFFLIAILLFAMGATSIPAALEAVFWIFLSILIHEFGHALAGRAFGMKSIIRLHFLGGLTEWCNDSEKKAGNSEHILISLAGPIAGFILGGGMFVIYHYFNYLPHIFLPLGDVHDLDTGHLSAFYIIIGFNLVLNIANLVPVFPLDGGQVTYYLLKKFKKIDAVVVSSILSIIFSIAIGIWAYYTQNFILIFFLLWIVFINYRRFQFDRDAGVREKAILVEGQLRKGNYNEVLDGINTVLNEAKTDRIKRWAYAIASLALWKLKDKDKLDAFIRQYPRHEVYTPLIKFLVLKYKDPDEATKFLDTLYKVQPDEIVTIIWLNERCARGETDLVIEETEKLTKYPGFGEFAREIQLALFENNEYEASVKVGQMIMAQKPSPVVSYNIACAFSRLERYKDAIDELKKAISLGFRNINLLLTDPDMNELRNFPVFNELIESVRENQLQNHKNESVG